MTYDEILADVSGVLRRFNKLRPTLSPEEAVHEIRRIVNIEAEEEAQE